MSYPSMKPPAYPTKKDGVPEAFVYRAEEEEYEKNEGVKEQFANFFKETSFTALVRIYNASSTIKRLAWLVVVLGMLSWLSLQCYWLIARYFNYPIEVKMDLLAATELEFPSVTVCNQNPLRASMLYEEPFHSALNAHMKLKDQDVLYSYFNEWYYNDWYQEYEDEEEDKQGPGGPGDWYTFSSTDWNSGSTDFSPTDPSTDQANMNPTEPQSTTPSGSNPASTSLPTTTVSNQTGTTESTDAVPIASTNDPTSPVPTTDFGTNEPTTTFLPPEGTPPDTTPPPTPQEATPSDSTPPTTPPNSPAKRRKRRAADMASFLKERSFNKWDMLDNTNISNTFYEDRDKEYIASMAFAVFSQMTDPSQLIRGGHQANDFLIDCKFGGFPCSPRNFTTFVNHKYGNCFTFNAEGNGDIIKTRFAGPSSGLALELYLNQEEYIPALSPAAGARILIHPRNSMPFPEDEGISIAPGFSTSIGLRMVDIKRLPPRHGVCADKGLVEDMYSTYMGTDYSKLSCLKSCFQSLVIQHCRCSVPQYFVNINSSMPVCNLTDSEAEKCSKNLPDQYPTEYTECDKNCPQPCSEVRHEKTLSVSQWPSKKYAKHLQSKVQQSNYMFYGNDVEEEDFAKVEVYFEDLLYQSIEQQKAYESQNLISDIGGQLGLWLGLSAITLGELFSFLFSLGQALTRGCVPKRKQSSRTPIKPIQMDYM